MNVFDQLGASVKEFVEKYLDMVVQYLKSFPWWAEALIILAVAILLVIGFIRLIVKSWKLLIVLVVLGAIGVAVYFFTKNNGETTTTTAIINSASIFLKSIL